MPDETEWVTTSDRNRRVSGARFRYVQCRRCRLVRLAEIPPELSRYYPNEYYQLPSRERIRAIADADTAKIDLVRRFVSRGRLMEIGPAHGVFAYQAKQAGFDVDVIEMDARCCDHLRAVVGVNALCSATPQDVLREGAPYDVIALWQVIEHLPDPWTVLDAAAAALSPGGILAIAAPNPDAWQLAVMGAEWPHIDAPRHLYLLPVDALTAHLHRRGLTRVHATTTDADAKRWNRFGWQRLLMNRMQGTWGERAGFVAGFGLSVLMAPFEARDPKGSTYTVVFKRS